MSGTHPLWEQAKEAPEQPGVYLFRDARGRVLYVGKAKQLRRRVLSYFSREQPPKTENLLARARQLEFVVTHSEVEALILENRLIKEHRPRYNVLLRDDKTYPYIKLTTGELFPRAELVRRVQVDGHTYFGPFLGQGMAARLMDLIRTHTQVRTCSWQLKPEGTLPRPCLYHQIGACLGPCVAGLTTPEEYRRAVEEVELLLSGRTAELKRRLEEQMWRAAEKEEYERAARYRDWAQALERLSCGQHVEMPAQGSFDVFALFGDGRDLSAVVLLYREGKLVDKREFHFEGVELAPEREFLSQFLPQYYEANPAVPPRILLPFSLEDREALEAFLAQKAGRRVRLVAAGGGKARKVWELAADNAREAFRLRFRHPRREAERVGEEVAAVLGLKKKVERVECFDVSHTQGEAAVAALVVWERGRLVKREYRSFHVNPQGNINDPAGIGQAVGRCYRRRLAEARPLPDLVVVDGGAAQLSAARAALESLGLHLPVVALAKRLEEIYRTPQEPPLALPPHHPARLLLQQLRDEAHRFAITQHRRRRRSRRMATQLLAIPGVGPQRAKKLLLHFGSLEGVRAASLEDLAPVVGEKLAAAVFRHLHPPVGPGGEGAP